MSLRSTSIAQSQRSTAQLQRLSDDRTGRLSRTGCVGATPARTCARANTQRPDVMLPAVTQCQIESSKHPERNFADRTRPITYDRTRLSVRSSLAQLQTRHVTRTECRTVFSQSSITFLRRVRCKTRSNVTFDALTGCTANVRCSVRENTSLTSPTSPPLLKCANHQVYHLVHMC
jgi:hypothetical protein